MRSRRPPGADDRPPDYSHRFHAGNVGDVWKHCVLVETLRRLAPQAGVRYLETHAGEGIYPLGPTGEWTAGIGRLWGDDVAEDGERPVTRYRALCRRLAGDGPRPRRYPGSPAFAAALLGPTARLVLWERDPRSVACLRACVQDDPRVSVRHGDGLAALAGMLEAAERDSGEVVVLIDPPWTTKSEWIAVPDALTAAVRRTTRARVLLWYPVKSLTRPNALLARLAHGGTSASVAELATTPLELQRSRLGGSGVVLVRPPGGVLAAVAAAAPPIGARCATHDGAWSLRLRTWTAR